LRLIKQSN